MQNISKKEMMKSIGPRLEVMLELITKEYNFEENCLIYSFIDNDQTGAVVGISNEIKKEDFRYIQKSIIVSILSAGIAFGQSPSEMGELMCSCLASAVMSHTDK